jgi:hypothetical protein
MLKKMLHVSAVLLLMEATSAAQGLDMLGNRAAGLGAFVAVADDASAVAWNPAGLVAGPIFNLSLDFARSRRVPAEPPAGGERVGKVDATLFAFGVPPLGLSYYRLEEVGLASLGAAAEPSPGRQQDQVSLRKLTTHHLGVTVLQSVGDYLTVGATAKVVRGSIGIGAADVATWDDGFDRADRVGDRGETSGDVDLGAMLAVGAVRAGLVVRNVTTPRFGEGEESIALARHARLGVAWGDGWPGLAATVLAFDADLTRVHHAEGERRDLAGGIEHWLHGRRIGLRAGMRASTVGEVRPIISGGGSYAVRSGTYVDVFVTGGTGGARGWGVGARVTF